MQTEAGYIPAPLLANEQARHTVLDHYRILDTDAEQAFDDLAALAAAICGTPIALVSLIDDERQWFKARVGLEVQSTPRDWSFCAHAILRPEELLEVPDALEDARFAGNPLVREGPRVRSYAGAPLVTPEGVPFGSLCVLDQTPRHLTPEQRQALQRLARQTVAQLELRLAVRHLREQSERDAVVSAQRQRAFEVLKLKNTELAESHAAALRANQAKSDFLSRMSHEIRTSMNGVLGMNQLLLGTPLSAEQRHFAEIIHSSGRTLIALIDDLLDLTKIESGMVEIEAVDFDAHRTLHEIVEIWSTQARAKGLEFASSIPAQLPRTLRGDPYRLRQVLNNLASNAIKFTAKGEVSMRVELTAETAERVTLRFSMADTGIGIRPEQAATLFSPFAQADVSTTRNYGGTGLGLAICKQLVEMMGGTIGLDSEAGKGSVFWFTVRLPISESGAVSAETAPAAGGVAAGAASPAGTRRILVAEDNQINRLVLLTKLKKLGYEVEAVVDGGAAVEAAVAGNFDMVLMDCEMPVMDGWEATRRIRAARGETLPILAVTAHAMAGDRERCLAAGMNGFITKPIDMELLSNLLAQWSPLAPQ